MLQTNNDKNLLSFQEISSTLSSYIINAVRSGETKMTVFDVVKELEQYPVIFIVTIVEDLIRIGSLGCNQDQHLFVCSI